MPGNKECGIMKLKRASFKFRSQIINFDQICKIETENPRFGLTEFRSFTMRAMGGTNYSWHLGMRGMGDGIHILLFQENLQLVKNRSRRRFPVKRIDCVCTIGLGSQDKPFYLKLKPRGVLTFDESHTSRRCGMVKLKELFENKDILLQENRLILTLILEVFENQVSLPQPQLLQEPKTTETILKDFQDLFDSKKFSDIEIYCGEEVFYCHKAILAARSKVFCAMFEEQMTEATTNKVTIDDMDPPALRILLRYMYTGRVSMVEKERYRKMYIQLTHGAEKYDLQELKFYLFNKMLEEASDKTVGHLAVAADRYNAPLEIAKEIRRYCRTHIARLMADASFREILVQNPNAFYRDDEIDMEDENDPDMEEEEDHDQDVESQNEEDNNDPNENESSSSSDSE